MNDLSVIIGFFGLTLAVAGVGLTVGSLVAVCRQGVAILQDIHKALKSMSSEK